MSTFNWTMNDTGVTCIVNGTPYTIRKDHPNWDGIKNALKNKDGEAFARLSNVEMVIRDKINACVTNQGKVTIVDGAVLYDNRPVHNVVTTRILELVRSDLPFDGMVLFLQNLMENPSMSAVNETYDFLAHRNLPITDDGCFLAYKSVDGQYWSKRSGDTVIIEGKTDREDGTGRTYNAPGCMVACARNSVDDDRRQECSYGLHVGALEYAGPGGFYNGSGDKTIIVKVNPRDVIAVPLDHDAQKMRVCRYLVESDYVSPLNKPVYEQTDDKKFDSKYENRTCADYEEEFVDNIVDLDDLGYGDEITFQYDGKTRTVSVEDVYNNTFCGMLLSPEDCAGQYRTFKYDKVSDAKYL